MRESKIERKCREWIEGHDGVLWKIKNQSRAGWPDRMIVVSGLVGFVEFKAPGKTPKPHQELIMNEMRDLGLWVFWTDSFEGFQDECLAKMIFSPTR